ncbi:MULTISPECIES: hypothetical protein [Bacillus]|uniref:hypothetical protein n=1 Tax=Bacillus sp. SRB_8 TaxID=1969377 RepID=UPI000DC4D931|nr:MULTISPECIES: hypothetical protein [Bacillus]RAN67378.1 hypothetical protein B5P40_25515 [Bacillus sp. SRB_8]WJE61213.1 hypothetical protein QRE64_27830 [Bacillus mycoides]
MQNPIYLVLGYAKMFGNENHDFINLKRMKDSTTLTLSADLFLLYIQAEKFVKDNVLVTS